VDDVDTACSELAQRGVVLLNGPCGPVVGGSERLVRRPRRSHLGNRSGTPQGPMLSCAPGRLHITRLNLLGPLGLRGSSTNLA
jgi:hypothetical protein